MNKNKKTTVPLNRRKVALMMALYTSAAMITISGAFFSIYSLMNNFTFKVLNNNVPGAVLGVLVVYLGIKDLISVRKLSKEVYSSAAVFSWQNFRRSKKSNA